MISASLIQAAEGDANPLAPNPWELLVAALGFLVLLVLRLTVGLDHRLRPLGAAVFIAIICSNGLSLALAARQASHQVSPPPPKSHDAALPAADAAEDLTCS